MESTNFLNLIFSCQSASNDLRTQAEKQLSSLASQNLLFTLDSLALLLCDEVVPENSRVYAATLIKNFISRDEEIRCKWHETTDDLRDGVKTKVVASLASHSRRVRRAACYAVATIAQVELNVGRWAEVIETLRQNALHEQESIRLASIETLGFIVDEIKPKLLNNEATSSIVETFIVNLLNSVENLEFVKICLVALEQSVAISGCIYENEVKK